ELPHFLFSSSRRHTRFSRDWSSDVCSSDLGTLLTVAAAVVVLLVAPAAIEQSRDFSDELPATVREIYGWPVIGSRLEEADAANRSEERRVGEECRSRGGPQDYNRGRRTEAL